MKPVILDFDGTVARQKLDDFFNTEQIPLYHLRDDLQFWGKEHVAESLRAYTDNFRHDSVCWLTGSGDFRHLTLFFLESVQEPFMLVVFDNHTGYSCLPPLKYYCGNWLYHAAKLPLCRKVIHIGATRGISRWKRDTGPHRLQNNEKLVIVAGNKTETLPQVCERALRKHLIQDMPIYVSVDKDVLCAKQAPCDWDNGCMEIDQVTHLLKWLAEKYRVVGADITGEKSVNTLYNKSIGKNLWSWLKHPAGRQKAAIRADLQHKMLNIEILKALGAQHVDL